LFNLNGFITIVGFISPYSQHRDRSRKTHQDSGLVFNEVHVSTSLEVCENRDVKGLYKKARAGEIKNFTGISDPYEAPAKPELSLDTNLLALTSSVEALVDHITKEGVLNPLCHSGERSVVTTTDLSNSCELLVDEEELNLLQVFQQGWCPEGLKCFMNENQLLESMYFRTFTDDNLKTHLQSIPLIYPINQSERDMVVKADRIILVNKITKSPVAVIEKPSVYNFK